MPTYIINHDKKTSVKESQEEKPMRNGSRGQFSHLKDQEQNLETKGKGSTADTDIGSPLDIEKDVSTY